MSHWAAKYIGLPWAANAVGPRAYYCWGLVQRVALERCQLRLPGLVVGAQINEDAIRDAAKTSGWVKAELPLQEDDIIVMRRKDGARHCGYAVRGNGFIGVLHADGHQSHEGPKGCVVFQTLEESTSCGYHDFQLWRMP